MTLLSWTSMPDLTPSRRGPGAPADASHATTWRYLSAATAHDAESPAIHRPLPPPPKHTVGDVMIKGVVAAHEEAAFKQIVDALVRNHISAVPVIDARRKVVGIVSESDLLARMSGGHLVLPTGHLVTAHAEERRKLHASVARELMTSPPVVTRASMPIADAAHLAAQARVRRLPVVDDDGVLIGMVTRADLLKVFLRADQEIRDDIRHNVLAGAVSFNPSLVDVEVYDGVVTVRGEVQHQETADALAHAMAGIGGVIAVDTTSLVVMVSADGARTWPRTRN